MESPSNDSQTKLVSHEPIVADGKKSFHNSDTSGGSSRYGFYRGSHVFNGATEFSSKRSAGRGSGSHSLNSNHGSSFSPHTGQSNVRPVRDSGEVRFRRPFKSFTTDDAGTQNHLDGKHVRILQRPLPSAGRLHSESGRGDDVFGSDKSSSDVLRQQQQQLKRGHRKKTLSLNPEEREALENLVEEVIIDGLGEAIIDSDGTSSSDDDECDAKGTRAECKPDGVIGKDSDVKDSRLSSTSKGNSKDSGACGDKHHSVKNVGRNVSRSNGKDYNRRGREAANGSATKAVKDVKRGSDLRQIKATPPDEEKEKPNAATVRGVNIYPAQLKVAIKHMDSLPPRFLRRLQTGTSRTAGNESILAHLTVRSPTEVQQGAETMRADDPSLSPTDRDRGKAKQNQLQETKKTIRNLLCDLDQYTDETVSKEYSGGGQASTKDKASMAGTNPVLQDGSGANIAPGMSVYYGQQYANKAPYISPNSLQPSVPSPPQTLQQQSFQFLAPASHSAAPRMLSCEELEREMLHGTQPLNTAPTAAESTAVPASDVAGSMPSFYPPAAQVNHLAPQVSHPQQQQQQPKKSQFSVDAPEFVSSYYMPNHAMSKQVPVAQSAESYYAVPPPMHNAEMGVQILHDNVHLPAKQVQYPVSVMPPPNLPQSASSGQEFADMPPGTAVAPTSYEMLQYDHMGAPGMGMLRNTHPYIAPVSVQMPLPVSGQGDGVSAMLEMDAMGYPAYQYVPGSNAYTTSYAPGPGFSQTAQPSFMPMPVATGPTMSSPNWIGDGSHQSQMTPPGWYPEYAGMPYANTELPPTRQPGFEDVVYTGGSLAYGEQQVMNSAGVEKWSYVPRAPVEAGRQKVLQLLNDGASVMVILIGGPNSDNLSLVRLASIHY